MKSMLIVLAAAGSLGMASLAHAQAELAQKLGCTNCHAMDTKKVGPSIKDISAKFKGNSGAEGAIVQALATGKGHPKVNASEADLTAVTKWVLSQ